MQHTDSTHGNKLVGVVHHGYQHVEQDDQRDDVVCPEHGGAHELRELMLRFHVGHVQVDEPEYRPEQGLERLKQPGTRTQRHPRL